MIKEFFILRKDKAKNKALKTWIRKELLNCSFKNMWNKEIKIEFVEMHQKGFRAALNINGICAIEDLKKHSEYLRKAFYSDIIEINEYKDYVIIDWLASDKVIDEYSYINLSPYQLLLGYNEDYQPLYIDMKRIPHLLITGLSGKGKSYCVKAMIKNIRNADVTLINAFSDDFDDTLKMVNGTNEMYEYLKSIKDNLYKRQRPLFLFIEEVGILDHKEINKIIEDILKVGRHYNIFVISIIQIALKSDIPFKQYFNNRMSFSQNDSEAYKVALGVNFNESLENQEFVLRSAKGLERGKTYNIK